MGMNIICRRCGIQGQIEGSGLNRDAPLPNVFKHMGHNPYSGDLHYQCPACGMVLLVDPVAILDSLTSGHPGEAAGETGRRQRQTFPG